MTSGNSSPFMLPGKAGTRSQHLLIVRHAETRFNDEQRIQGHKDSALTPKGMRQAAALARTLAKKPIHRIYSSDLGRAMATTRFIAKRFKKKIVADDGLREIHLGHWEGMTPKEVNLRYRNGYERWRRSPSRMRIPGGESVTRFRKRILAAIRRILKSESGGTVLIVTHGGAIASLLASWLKADFDRVLLNLKLDNTGVTSIEVTGGRVILHEINDVAHLNRHLL